MTEAPLLFAFAAGTVASANPCGFALLPAFFLSYAGSSEPPRPGTARRVGQALAAGGAMTAAFALVFGGVGAGLAAGASALMPAMPWATIAVGAALVALGVAVVAGRHVSIPLPRRLHRMPGGYPRPFLFGLAYGIASLSCTVPVFLSVVGASLGGGGPLVRAGMFLAYAVGMGTVLTALTIGAAIARSGLHRAVRRVVPHVSRVSGIFLLGAGAYLIYYWTFFLLPGSERRVTGGAPIRALNRLADRLQGWLGFGAGAWVGRALLGAIALLGVAALWRWTRSRRRRSEARSPAEAPARNLVGR